jgi:radical SAM superfamily enzyme YgiQ (UPF0313 family)
MLISMVHTSAANYKTTSSGKNVLLLFPPMREHLYGVEWRHSETYTAPLGLLYLVKPLEKAGYDVTFVDLIVDKLEKNEYFDRLMSADFILISCYTHALDNIHTIISDIRSVNERAFIICGGPHCNDFNVHIKGADITVFGEADLIISEILNRLTCKESLENIPGLSHKLNGSLIRNPGTQIVEDLDLIEAPPVDISNNRKYGYLHGMKLPVLAPMITSRGCPFNCTFCSFRRTRYRERSVDMVFQEIKMYADEGVSYFIFYDDNFLMRKDRVTELADRIIESKLNVKIALQGRVDLTDIDVYKKLKKAGVFFIIFGIESANEDVLEFYSKDASPQKAKEAVAAANAAGILTAGHFIIGAPMEKRRHLEVNKNYFKEIPLDFLVTHILAYVRGTPIWKDAYQKGLIDGDELLTLADKRLSNFTTEELIEAKTELLKSFYKNPKRLSRISYKWIKAFGIHTVFQLSKAYFRKAAHIPTTKFFGAKTKSFRA